MKWECLAHSLAPSPRGIRASTLRSIGPVQDSSHRLALVPNELPLPSFLQCMSLLLAQNGHRRALN